MSRKPRDLTGQLAEDVREFLAPWWDDECGPDWKPNCESRSWARFLTAAVAHVRAYDAERETKRTSP